MMNVSRFAYLINKQNNIFLGCVVDFKSAATPLSNCNSHRLEISKEELHMWKLSSIEVWDCIEKGEK